MAITFFSMFVLLPAGLWMFTRNAARRAEAALPPKGRFIELPGVRLHVLEQGKGYPLLLIHGLSGQMHHYLYGVAGLLATRFRVIVVDRPGSGYSLRSANTPANISNQADTMAALIEAMQLDKPIVVGHSFGGAVALALAQRHPQRVAGLALLAPLSHLTQHVSSAFALLGIPAALRGMFSKTLALPLAMYHREKTLAQVFGPEAVPSDFLIKGGAILGARPSHFVAACQDLSAAALDLPHMTKLYPSMNLPVAVLFGNGDRILNAQEHGAALVHKIPGAQLRLIDAGHMLPITNPGLSAQLIQELADRALPPQVQAS